jgi:hypothetical protein
MTRKGKTIDVGGSEALALGQYEATFREKTEKRAREQGHERH